MTRTCWQCGLYRVLIYAVVLLCVTHYANAFPPQVERLLQELPPAEAEEVEWALREIAQAEYEIASDQPDQAHERLSTLNFDAITDPDIRVRCLFRSGVMLRDIGKDKEASLDRLLEAYDIADTTEARQTIVSTIADYAIADKDQQLLDWLTDVTANDWDCRVVVDEAKARKLFLDEPGSAAADLQQLLGANPGNAYLQRRIREYPRLAKDRDEFDVALQYIELAIQHYPELQDDIPFQLNKGATEWSAGRFLSAVETGLALLETYGDTFPGAHKAYWLIAISFMSLGDYVNAELYLDELEKRLDTYEGEVPFAESIRIRKAQIRGETRRFQHVDLPLPNATALNEENAASPHQVELRDQKETQPDRTDAYESNDGSFSFWIYLFSAAVGFTGVLIPVFLWRFRKKTH